MVLNLSAQVYQGILRAAGVELQRRHPNIAYTTASRLQWGTRCVRAQDSGVCYIQISPLTGIADCSQHLGGLRILWGVRPSISGLLILGATSDAYRR